MSLPDRLGKDTRASYYSIYSLGHCAEYDPSNDYWGHDRPVEGPFFDIGQWETVDVVSTKKPRSTRVREVIDNDNIDYNSHLTPKIENMRRPTPSVKPIRKEIPGPVMDLGEKTECFCYVCLIRLNINKEIPNKMISLAEGQELPKLIKVTISTKDLVLKMIRAMTNNHVARPFGLNYTKFNYQQFLEFFEGLCRPELMDVGVALTDYILGLENEQGTRKMRRLSEVYKAFVYASTAKILYKFLSIHLTEEKLHRSSLVSVKGHLEYDPMGLTEPDLHEPTNIEPKVFRLFPGDEEEQ